jgi:hypothetical protein
MTHSITPPPELVEQWDEECESGNNSEVSNTFDALQLFASKAAQWGSDQELEACCEWLGEPEHSRRARGASELRAARRSKPPSLKKQALERLDQIHANAYSMGMGFDPSIIRLALEQLDD